MSIMSIDSITSTNFVHMNTLVLLRLIALLLGCRVRWRNLRGIRWSTLVALITLFLMVPI